VNESTTVVTAISQGSVMDATAVATIGGVVMVLTQIFKRALPGDWDAWGPHIAAILALGGVALWVYSAPTFPPQRTDTWAIFAGWVSVFATAVGLYQSAKMVTAPGEGAPAVPTTSRPVTPHQHQQETV